MERHGEGIAPGRARCALRSHAAACCAARARFCSHFRTEACCVLFRHCFWDPRHELTSVVRLLLDETSFAVLSLFSCVASGRHRGAHHDGPMSVLDDVASVRHFLGLESATTSPSIIGVLNSAEGLFGTAPVGTSVPTRMRLCAASAERCASMSDQMGIAPEDAFEEKLAQAKGLLDSVSLAQSLAQWYGTNDSSPAESEPPPSKRPRHGTSGSGQGGGGLSGTGSGGVLAVAWTMARALPKDAPPTLRTTMVTTMVTTATTTATKATITLAATRTSTGATSRTTTAAFARPQGLL